MRAQVIKYGDHVDTDVIIPARYLNTSDPKELAKHCMEDIDKDFAEKNKDFELKAGFVDGNVIDSEGVKSLAKMPSKEVLLAQVLGGLNTPIVNFAGVLNANLRGLVVALNAIAEKQSA